MFLGAPSPSCCWRRLSSHLFLLPTSRFLPVGGAVLDCPVFVEGSHSLFTSEPSRKIAVIDLGHLALSEPALSAGPLSDGGAEAPRVGVGTGQRNDNRLFPARPVIGVYVQGTRAARRTRKPACYRDGLPLRLCVLGCALRAELDVDLLGVVRFFLRLKEKSASDLGKITPLRALHLEAGRGKHGYHQGKAETRLFSPSLHMRVDNEALCEDARMHSRRLLGRPCLFLTVRVPLSSPLPP